MLERVGDTFNVDGRLKIMPKCVVPVPHNPMVSGASLPVLREYEGHFRLVCLCRYYAHKNLEIICDVFEQFGDILKGVVVFLTIAAHQHPHARSLLQRIRRSGLSNQIVNLGPIPEREIPACLHNCEGLLFPTKMESLSGSYLDAMQCGLPILTSDLDFARQVCCDAAVYFDPSSPEAVAKTILRLKSDVALRRQLAEAGRDRLRQAYSLSWAEVASQVVTDLKACVKSPDGRIHRRYDAGSQ
jgi:glycosyltransferase involved in cell wall biosynthesis